jgi:DUF2934 family protein
MAKRTGKSQTDITTGSSEIQPKTARTRQRRSTANVSTGNDESVDITAEPVPATTSGTVGAAEFSAHEVAHDNATVLDTELPAQPSEEEIRFRAYQRYLERGGVHGADFDDWLLAERELRRR